LIVEETDVTTGIKYQGQYFSEDLSNSFGYWALNAFILDKSIESYLFNDIAAVAAGNDDIVDLVLNNYLSLLNNELFLDTTLIKSFPLSLSGLDGRGILLNTHLSPEVFDTQERGLYLIWAVDTGMAVIVGNTSNGVLPEGDSVTNLEVFTEFISLEFIKGCDVSFDPRSRSI